MRGRSFYIESQQPERNNTVPPNSRPIRPKVYTVAEFARVFAISPRLVRAMIRREELPALRIGRVYRIPRKAAEAYLARAFPPLLSPRRITKQRAREVDNLTAFLFPIESLH